jgi:hypothetical protein
MVLVNEEPQNEGLGSKYLSFFNSKTRDLLVRKIIKEINLL